MTCPKTRLSISCSEGKDIVCADGKVFTNACEAARRGYYAECSPHKILTNEQCFANFSCPKAKKSMICDSSLIEPTCTSTAQFFKNRCEAEAAGWYGECSNCTGNCAQTYHDRCPSKQSPSTEDYHFQVYVIIHVIYFAIIVTIARLLKLI